MVSLYFVFCLCCVLGVLSVAGAGFSPVDCFLISCGKGKALALEDGRVFQPDLGNSNVGLSSNSHFVVSNSEKRLADLYNSARVFTSNSTYTIRNKQTGRHWLRLHFYPVKNKDYDLKSASFSVVANGVTLHHRFSYSKLHQTGPLVKEYVVEIGSVHLALTLTPDAGSVAFINGVEVVSVPKGQFDFGVVPIPKGSASMIPSSTALETVYRLNMGGPKLTPENDTLWRVWNTDYPFLVNPGAAVNVTTDPRSVKYRGGATVEIAPDWVYATAQEMADAQVVEPNFNLTWGFRVEPGFTYFIRMHFCDIVSDALGELIFNVYVNEYIAVDSLDISSKTTELSAAYFLDFIVNVSKDSDKLLVKVGPSTSGRVPINAILNGLEIMRLSDELILMASETKKRVLVVLFVCLGGLAILVLVSVLTCLIYYRVSVVRVSVPTCGVSETNPKSAIFAFTDILGATRSFDESLAIGVGGFGKVYKGVLENGVTVAVKRGNKKSQQGLVEFRTEIEMLSKLRHRHLVSLIGFCEELNEMILVYEFMAGGSLRRHLYGSDLPPLSWKRRVEICIGAAKGLHYLHTGASESIIHRDVKTTNILLDEKLEAKVADFGLSKLGPALDQTHVSTAVKGSFGYLDPEYYRRQQLTEKSDVYSFGVVLMEVLCARPAINPALPREQVNIAEWAMQWQKKGRLEEIIDPRLLGKVSLESLRKFGETAEKCLAEYGSDRPSMGDVLWNLEYVLQLHEASMNCIDDDDGDNSSAYIPDMPYLFPRTESDGIYVASHGESSTAVFSEILNPKGR